MNIESRLKEMYYRDDLFLMSLDGIGALYPYDYEEYQKPRYLGETSTEKMLGCIKIPYPSGTGTMKVHKYLWDAIDPAARDIIKIVKPESYGLNAVIQPPPTHLGQGGHSYKITVSNVENTKILRGFDMIVTVWISSKGVGYTTEIKSGKYFVRTTP